VLRGSEKNPVVVDFWANWCGPCKTLAPVLEKAIETTGNVTLAKYNIDESSTKADEYKISSIPAVFAFSKGKVIAEFVGAKGPFEVNSFVKKVKEDHSKGEL